MNLKRELDLVTVGTVADMVPLTGDNRILVKFGMEMMRKQPRMWLRSFFRQGILYHEADGYALSFIIVPRINAAGRVSNPVTALQFLTSQEEEEADRLLLELDKANRQRQGIEEGIVQEALRRIETENLSGRCSLVLYKEDWPIGVLGIVAQKLAENYGKPCIVFTRVNGTWKGSARGVPGLDLHGTVSTLSPLLLKYGGHKFACGLSLKEENLSRFPEAFEEAVKECLVEVERAVKVDAIIEFDDLTRELVEYIELLAPFGMGNPRPGLLLTPSSVSLTNRFVKLTDQKKRTWRGYLQKRTALPDAPDARVVACPAIKEEMGEKFIQLHVREFVTE
jgi:single-stranded-DNA-specific exonuclease